MIREAAVRLEVQLLDLQRQPRQQRLEPDRRHAVRAIDRDAQRRDCGAGDSERLAHEAIHDVDAFAPASRSGRRACRLADEPLDLAQAAGLANGLGVAAADLHAVVLPGVVRRGQHDPAVRVQRIDREIQHRRRREPDVEHCRARLARAAHERLAELRGMRARVATDREPPRSEETHRRVPDAIRELRIEFARHEAADVIRLEDRHAAHSTGEFARCRAA